MFDELRMKDALACYKQGFIDKQWPNEKYKWEAVKHFQDNWNINATDFADMLTRSLEKTSNLLASRNNYPATMIQDFARTAPEEVRGMFMDLFDDSKDVYERIDQFKTTSNSLLGKYGNGAKQHFQTENSITTYLWLRFPDKYYIYKWSEINTVANELACDYHFKQGAYADNIRNFLKLYNEICMQLHKDEELVSIFKSQLTGTCYPDPELRTLTFDFGFYVSRNYGKQKEQADGEWFPSDYTPGLSVDEWVALLNDESVFTPSSLEIIRRMKDYGGQATCTQLSMKYGESANFYNSGSTALARRIAQKTNCPIRNENTENAKYWPILYVGKQATQEEDGCYLWKLREELSQALDKFFLDIIREENPSPMKADMAPYDKNAFLDDVYMQENQYDMLVCILMHKKNVILQGAPGVGKTFTAKRLAYSIMGEKDESRIEFVQFHQNYSYEDFIMGYKPVDNGFELKSGIFYRFCQKAANQPEKEFFFIIDEINRGNMSKIFGELLMLIERDYRGCPATLAYNGLAFSVPKNLYMIGMMNTADRSLAMIDYALRRRFSFFEMNPGFDSEGFSNYRKALNNDTLNALVVKIKELNKEIAADRSLGKGFCIGHSYFCGQQACTDEWLRSVVDYDILPMLSEYWFDDSSKFQYWENILHGVFQ
ncbi:MAG: AAA family ATPase [Lentisphaeria bacterium]|nr:AAA family ATPase [Sphaerochaetaceae bacterium]MDD3952921.1 AAA family ATPase [Lentisphaeria bacterium]